MIAVAGDRLAPLPLRIDPLLFYVTADGERFIIGITPELPARPIHVVSDWRRELEE